MHASAFPALLMVSTLVWVAPAAGAQEAPDAATLEASSLRCDRGTPMPTPFPDLSRTAPMPEVQPTGPPPVPIPNLCDAPAVAALVAPRSSVQFRSRPLPTGDLDELRQRYDHFRQQLDPARPLRLAPVAPPGGRE